MTRTVTALYDSRSEAESACERLTTKFETCSTKIIDQNSGADAGSSGGTSETSLSDLYVSDEDRDAYGEGVRRGGFMLCAEVDSDEDADSIVEVLEQTSAVDMDQRQQDWRSEGWQPSSSSGGQMGTGTAGQTSSEFGNQSEARNVGTRQADRGGSGVRSYTRETRSESDRSSNEGGNATFGAGRDDQS